MSSSENATPLDALSRINSTWLSGDVEALAPLVDPGIVMALPGFVERVEGREPFLAGFRDFCSNARVHKFRDYDYRTDVIGDTAVVTFRYEMVYERSGERYRAKGRDLWVFRQTLDGWVAIWRAMLDVDEESA